jgi:Asp/Glu/hydantoin racemase
MTRKAAIIHAVPSLVGMFDRLASELIPDVSILHLADDGLLRELRASGTLTESLMERLTRLATFAEAYGAEVVMFNCSSLSPLVEQVGKRVQVPVFTVDEAMAEQAVKLGTRIGVLATLQNTLAPTSDLLRRRAAVNGKAVVVETVMCEGAFDAFRRGDMKAHDNLVLSRLDELTERVDVVVLAQASMARVMEGSPKLRVPVLASPRLGVERLKQILDALQPEN